MGWGKAKGGMPWQKSQSSGKGKGWGWDGGWGKSAGKGKGKGKVQQTQWTKQESWSMPWAKGKGKSESKGQAKGKGKGGGSTPKALPAGFKVNATMKYKGTVEYYRKLSGFGFIALQQKDVVPEDKVFVHWSGLLSQDRFPLLQQGMDVEFKLEISEDTGKKTLRAKDVSLPGGGLIAIQDQVDAEKKEFVGGQDLRYTGVLKFYKAKEGFGYLTLDDGFALGEEVPKDIRVERSEVNCGGEQPRNLKIVKQVEFGIWKNAKGVHKAYNMTLPGGIPIDVNATSDE